MTTENKNKILSHAQTCIVALLAIFTTMTANAQLREFTLEDLNFGGNNYHNMVPKNRHLTWWGDNLVHLDVEECYTVDKNTGKEKLLFKLDDINKCAETKNGSDKIHHLLYAAFPYHDKPLVLIKRKNERLLIDFKAKKTVWKQNSEGETHEDWTPHTRAVAFVKDDNLYVTDADGKTRQLTTDGSHDIVYGQSVHRDEFGIYKGTFWSPDGKRLAFYRMDQSMVTDYPLVDIDTRVATEIPTKYPMAGEASHKVTVGVYDLKTNKTVYLKAGDPTDRYFTNIAWSPTGEAV